MAILIRLSLAVLLALAASGEPGAVQQASPLGEPEAKASFLMNLALFAEWPAGAVHGDAFVICVAGATPVSQALKQLQGQVVGGRPVKMRDVREQESLTPCQVLFLPAMDARRLAATLSAAGRSPVITVGESDALLESGGMLWLRVERSKLRFDVNLGPVERAGFKFSARLLALAASVTRDGHVVKP